jgi:hypothetical protein
MKIINVLILTILFLIMTACGSASNSASPASPNDSQTATGALPVIMQMALGTLKLDGAPQDVTAEQAAELLPLWQTLQVLYNSDTAADQEIEALITQIQETMTSEQTQAIDAMNLTREDIMTVMQEQGTALGNSAQNRNSQSGNSSNNGGGGFVRSGGGNMPVPPDGGEIPGGGFGGGQGSGLSTEQIATAQASRQTGGASTVSPALFNALIELLQKKAGS